MRVPDHTIVVLPYDDFYRGKQEQIFFSLRGHTKRQWFSRHAYLCLPLVIGNQYGIGVRSLFNATLRWNGGPDPGDTSITIHNAEEAARQHSLQTLDSHFGLGIVTVQTAFSLRTPPNVNLITLQPPNQFIDGLQNMMGVVEADNLRRDFSFNLKLTRPGLAVEIKVGDVLSAVMPCPRGFVEKFELVDAFQVLSGAEIKAEQQTGLDFGEERRNADPKKPRGVGRRYYKGEDVYGKPFVYPHQKTLKGR